jgi:integrase
LRPHNHTTSRLVPLLDPLLRGKKQLHIDEAKRFVDEALKNAGDPISVACAAMVYTGLRPGEIMGLQVRDLEGGGQTALASAAEDHAVFSAHDPARTPACRVEDTRGCS